MSEEIKKAKDDYYKAASQKEREKYIHEETDKLFKSLDKNKKAESIEVDAPVFDENGNAVLDENGKQKTTKKTIKLNKDKKNASKELQKLYEKQFNK